MFMIEPFDDDVYFDGTLQMSCWRFNVRWRKAGKRLASFKLASLIEHSLESVNLCGDAIVAGDIY
jgi:hypothetical protein